MTRRKKSDNDQYKIMKELRELGLSVVSIHTVGRGVPDLIVGFNGFNFLIEVKTPGGNNKLTDDEKKFFDSWNGTVIVATNTYEILDGLQDYIITTSRNEKLNLLRLLEIKKCHLKVQSS